MSTLSYDVVIIGGGHAGAEAAHAAARLGARTALVTFSADAIGRMSCNPAIGGIGKGQMVREVDALGGLMGLATDEAGIQFRMLNRRKGPAVWAPRAQTDRELYARVVQRLLAETPNLDILEGTAEDLELVAARDGQRELQAVILGDGRRLACRCAVITSGTFLRALMHTGEQKTAGGRIGERAAVGLSAALERAGLRLGRLKTGTPPRVARDSIDYAALSPQPGDEPPTPLSFMTDRIEQTQVPCWITWTTPATHALIRENLHRAPMYSGQILASGPRYCPSIEDKVVRFADKSQHQLFLEPEGRDSDRIYVNGISTSLPQDVQERIVAGIPGLERARVLQWGYAVEYDFVPPDQIDATLMTRGVRGLFLAGQINGTSGYEEAAGQGLLAGINAARRAAGEPPVVLGRDQAYIGVMIDDLVTRGVTEPYRMFSSRAEHRLHLRYDNADERLTPIGHELGLARPDRMQRFARRRERRSTLHGLLTSERFEGRPLAEWLRRPDEDGERFLQIVPALAPFRHESDVFASALVDIKYAGYIERQERAIAEFQSLERRALPPDFDFRRIPHLRREALERWAAARPRSIGQAARMSGIHPTDVTLLLVALGRGAAQVDFETGSCSHP